MLSALCTLLTAAGKVAALHDLKFCAAVLDVLQKALNLEMRWLLMAEHLYVYRSMLAKVPIPSTGRKPKSGMRSFAFCNI